MKKIYICGDSFGVSDPEYGACWADILAQSHNYQVTNLSQVCASNLMIGMQVDQAIGSAADYIILLCTSSTRSQLRHNHAIVPYSVHSLDSTTPFTNKQLNLLREFHAECFDLELAIYENQLIIEAVLQRLVDSGCEFCFDQGGFEHPWYGGQKRYFEKFDQYRSRFNLWDHASTRSYRPYYHIQDAEIHQRVADYYAGLIHDQT
jgi:hypothetical protein